MCFLLYHCILLPETLGKTSRATACWEGAWKGDQGSVKQGSSWWMRSSGGELIYRERVNVLMSSATCINEMAGILQLKASSLVPGAVEGEWRSKDTDESIIFSQHQWTHSQDTQSRSWGLFNLPQQSTTPSATQKQLEKMSREYEEEMASPLSLKPSQFCIWPWPNAVDVRGLIPLYTCISFI